MATDVYITAVAVGDVFADPTYQRVLDVARARKMASTWDRRLAGILEVSDRGENANPRYAVLDGQHRWAAAKFLETPPSLVANVHSGLTLADEAALFDKLNRQRTQISTWDHWKARSAAGDELVAAVEQIAAAQGLGIGPKPSDGQVACVSTLEKIAKIDIALLDETIGFIVAVWGRRRDAMDAPIIHGIALVLNKLRDQIEAQRLVDAMIDVLPRQLRTQATALRDMQPGTLPVVTAIVIMGHYNKRPGKRIEVSHKTFGGTGVVNNRKGSRPTPRPTVASREPVVAGLTVVGDPNQLPRTVPTDVPPAHAYTDELARRGRADGRALRCRHRRRARHRRTDRPDHPERPRNPRRIMNTELSDQNHPDVVRALTRKCRIFPARPGSHCVDPNGQPLRDRIVHQDRTHP